MISLARLLKVKHFLWVLIFPNLEPSLERHCELTHPAQFCQVKSPLSDLHSPPLLRPLLTCLHHRLGEFHTNHGIDTTKADEGTHATTVVAVELHSLHARSNTCLLGKLKGRRGTTHINLWQCNSVIPWNPGFVRTIRILWSYRPSGSWNNPCRNWVMFHPLYKLKATRATMVLILPF